MMVLGEGEMVRRSVVLDQQEQGLLRDWVSAVGAGSVADVLGVSAGTVRRWCRTGRIGWLNHLRMRDRRLLVWHRRVGLALGVGVGAFGSWLVTGVWLAMGNW